MVTTAVLGGVVAIGFLTIASAFFSSSEIAIFSLERHRVESMAAEASAGGTTPGDVAALQRLQQDPHRLLVTILVGNNFVNIAIASIATTLLVAQLPEGQAVLVSTLGISTLVLVFGEIVPKSYGVGNAESWARRVARPLAVLQTAMYPVVAVFDAVTGAMNRLLGGGRDIERPYVTREELTALVRTAERLGVIEDDEQAMIQRVFRFASTPVGNVLVPRADVVAVEAGATVADAIEVCTDNRLTRLPVYRGELDDVVGYVDLRDLVAAPADAALPDLARPVLHVFEGREVDEVLAELQTRRGEVAIVFDQFGGVEGLVTVEDLVEEIVGEIFDVGERRAVVPLSAERVRASGDAPVAAVNEALGTSLPAEGGETVAALLSEHLGRPPEQGEYVDVHGTTVTVTDVEDNRVLRVVVERHDGDGPPGDRAATDDSPAP